MNTIATDSQFSLSTPNNEGRLEVPADTPLGQIFANTDEALGQLAPHASTLVRAVVEMPVSSVDVSAEPTPDLNVETALKNAYEAQDYQFTVDA